MSKRFACAVLAMTLPAAALAAAPAAAQAASATVTPRADGIDVATPYGTMRVTALTDAILRVRLAKDGRMPEDASWAVPAAVRAQHVAVRPMADGFATAAIRVRIDPASGRMTVEDMTGKVVVADAADPVRVDGAAFTLKKALPQAEHIYGMGDKTGTLDRRGYSYVDWDTDAFGFLSSTDPIYKSIPFYIGVGGEGGSYGLFLDNTWRTWFDFGHREDGVTAIGGPDGPIDYYVIAGPTTADVVHRYTDLTGKAPLVPKWALGYQQSRYSYGSAAELRQVAARLRQDHIPTDVLWLDIGFLDKNTPFTVDKQTFPDLPGLIADMGKQGMKVITITDLHVAANRPKGTYPPYDTGSVRNVFVHRADGQVYVAPVWPGSSVFPDFTMASARDWWGTLFRDQVAMGVAGSWNDMNEPAVFDTPTKTMPLDNVHRIASDDFAPRTGTHAELHNVYGMENTRATYDGLRRLAPNERAFVMTRASYAGGQRYAVTWTGDNRATWDHLKLSVQQIINLGLSGFSYGAADVSGFAGGPSADLLTRWFEIGAFYPVFRDHSATGTPRVEPWVDGPEQEAIRRRFIEERYRLMPYLYGLADQNARFGDPIMRPVFYDYPEASNFSCDQSIAFTLGRDLLVAPPPEMESPQSYDVCLPKGGWYDYWTGKRVGGAQSSRPQAIQSASQATGQAVAVVDRIRETPSLGTLPVFVRAGSILPRQAVTQSTSEIPQGPLMLDVYPGDDCSGTLYADDGHSMAFEKGGYLRQTIRCTVTPTGVSVTFSAREGKYPAWWRQIAVTVHGWTGDGTAMVAGRSVAGRSDAQAGTVTVTVPDQPRETTIPFSRQ